MHEQSDALACGKSEGASQDRRPRRTELAQGPRRRPVGARWSFLGRRQPRPLGRSAP